MQLPYTNEIFSNPDGIACKVLNIKAINFNGSFLARKSTETLVRCALGGEMIETKNSGKVESVYKAQVGDAIFINLHNQDDMYVPGNPDGSRWQFKDIVNKGYIIVGDDQENGGIRIKSTSQSTILHEAITEPTCIKNAWGEGQHQFLFAGATLKFADDKITGIDKAAFDSTWEISYRPPVQQMGEYVANMEQRYPGWKYGD